MLNLAALLFALAAVGGLVMVANHLKSKPIPLPLAIAHGALAAVALVILILAVTGGTTGTYLNLALILFVVAALGGFVLFASHLKGKPLSTPVVFVHGGVAVVAFLLLLITIL